MLKRALPFLLITFVFTGCQTSGLFRTKSRAISTSVVVVDKPTEIPKREFRAAWIASVANIDWPSKKGLSSFEQQLEYNNLTDALKAKGMNAVFVQVRDAADAFYAKSNEPWSEWLMGEQGKAPEPIYDPMEYMIAASHDKNLEFHAWLNLNRGKHKNAKSISSDHITNTKPEWFIAYDGYKIFDFGNPTVRKYIKDIVINMVKNYDVDGIHFDDYFYPYKVKGETFKDQDSFKKYGRGFTDVEDWRRDNINILVKEISEEITDTKPWVKFGISPFSVWRNKVDDPAGSETKAGQPSYDYLYADTRKWAQEGWIDYIVPQIYFPIEHKLVPYATMVDWWAANCGKAQLYIGHGVYRIDPESDTQAWKETEQISRQLEYNRLMTKVQGSVYFSASSLIKNKLDWTKNLEEFYRYPALTPVLVQDKLTESKRPNDFKIISLTSNEAKFIWNKDYTGQRFVLYRYSAGEEVNIADPSHIIYSGSKASYDDADRKTGQSYIYVLTSINRYGVESEAVILVK